ncbi:MAG: MFS transporter [Atopobiaceae bacterium]|nr:MFS transporter [Atopobiaceae bacterium]
MMTQELRESGKKPWLVMAVCCGMVAAGLGLSLNAAGVFYAPVADDLGMMRGTFSLHITVFSLVTAATTLLLPAIMKRFPYKAILIPSLAVAVVSTFLMGRVSTPIAFYILGAIRGFSTCLFAMAPANMIVGAWFNKSSGTATSIVMASSGIAGALGSTAFAAAISSMGWRNAYAVVAAAILVLVLPAVFLPFQATPEAEGLLPYGGARVAQATKGGTSSQNVRFSYTNPTFLFVVLMAVLMAFVTSIAQHFPGHAQSIGLAIGATMTSVAMVGNILMKLGLGVLSDRVGAPKATIVMSALCVTGLALIFVGGSVPLMLAGSLLFGGSYAVGSVSSSLLPRHFFGAEQFDQAYPPVAMAGNVGAAVSMSAIGFVYDATQSYAMAFILCIGLAVASIAAVLLADKLARR